MDDCIERIERKQVIQFLICNINTNVFYNMVKLRPFIERLSNSGYCGKTH
jgi:hypothetical protein